MKALTAHWRLVVVVIVAGFVSGYVVEVVGERLPDAGFLVHYLAGVGAALLFGLLTAWVTSLIKPRE